MATLTVRRVKRYADKLRKYRILLDGVEIGKLAEGATLHHQIDPGQHILEARIDWCASHPVEFSGSEDQVIVVSSALSGWRLLLLPFYAMFQRRGYVKLELQ